MRCLVKLIESLIMLDLSNL